jgi:hypothetical protein
MVKPQLDEVLANNREATEQVKAATDELTVAHAVLEKNLPGSAEAREIDEALERAHAAEKLLSESADKLEESNEKLQEAIKQVG